MSESDIQCTEIGSEYGRVSEPFSCTEDDRRELQHHADLHHLLFHSSGDGRMRIEGLAYCGRIRLPSGRHVLLGTKLPVGRLVEWLAFVDAIPPLDSWSSSPTLSVGDDLAAVLVKLYLREVELVTRFHRRPGYRLENRVSSEIHGAIDERRLAAVGARLPALPTRSRERTQDTLANRVIASALRAATRLIPAEEGADLSNESSRLARLLREWSDVRDQTIRGAIDSALALAAPPVGYRTALQLARLLLVGAGIDTIGGDGGDSFLVNMAAVWEAAVRQMAEEWARRGSWLVASDAERTRRWDDERQSTDPARWLTADALVRASNGKSLVLDAKYKREFGNEARNDRFQMAAYCLAFGAALAVLVYPSARNVATEARLLLRSSLDRAPAEIHSLALPIAAGPSLCTATLGQHLDRIVAGQSTTDAPA